MFVCFLPAGLCKKPVASISDEKGVGKKVPRMVQSLFSAPIIEQHHFQRADTLRFGCFVSVDEVEVAVPCESLWSHLCWCAKAILPCIQKGSCSKHNIATEFSNRTMSPKQCVHLLYIYHMLCKYMETPGTFFFPESGHSEAVRPTRVVSSKQASPSLRSQRRAVTEV